MICIPEHCKEQYYRTSMTGETSLPWHEYLQKALPTAEIILRLIKDAVSKPCSDYSSYQQCIEKRIQKVLRNAFPTEEPSEDEPSQDKTGDKKNRVPSQTERADLENDRIHIPVNEQKLEHTYIIWPATSSVARVNTQIYVFSDNCHHPTGESQCQSTCQCRCIVPYGTKKTRAFPARADYFVKGFRSMRLTIPLVFSENYF